MKAGSPRTYEFENLQTLANAAGYLDFATFVHDLGLDEEELGAARAVLEDMVMGDVEANLTPKPREPHTAPAGPGRPPRGFQPGGCE